jgi:hypothetical protein
MAPWQRLIRFEDESGEEHFGEPLIETAEELQSLLDAGKLGARLLTGDGPFSLSATQQERKVKKLLGVLRPTDVPIIKCIGLNYMKHSKSASWTSTWTWTWTCGEGRCSSATHD